MSKALEDVKAERQRQIEKGYTAEHDDQHGVLHLFAFMQRYTGQAAIQSVTIHMREPLVKAAAVALAAIEQIDRQIERQTHE